MNDDTSDWNLIFETVDALFFSLADGIACRAGMSLEYAHEEAWTLFENGYFKLVGTDDNIGVVPCLSDNERRLAAEQNKPLSDYRRRVIDEARLWAAGEPWRGAAERASLLCRARSNAWAMRRRLGQGAP